MLMVFKILSPNMKVICVGRGPPLSRHTAQPWRMHGGGRAREGRGAGALYLAQGGKPRARGPESYLYYTLWEKVARFGRGFICGGSNFVSVQPGWSYLEKREAEWSYLPFCFAGCALVFLHLTLPRGYTDRFSGDYGARPGNFHWRTGRNRWKSTMLSNNWRIIK